MKTRTLLLTSFLFIGFSFNNCSDPFDCDFDPVPEFFDIRDIRTVHMDSNRNFIDDTAKEFEQYGSLDLVFVVDYIASTSKKENFGFSLMNQAYGCTPSEPGFSGSKEEAIQNITIITLNDFDDNHMANDTLNDLFIATYPYRQGVPISLGEFLDDIQTNVEEEVVSLVLRSPPTIDEEFQVRVRVDLSNGERYETISDPIILY